ncbi:MAG: type I methionyl aminopeptidase [Candidatus Omnitrophica bacterium]|nr:type I methionyl aminopeptidase [Candidatus Omnitrophota bacterium]
MSEPLTLEEFKTMRIAGKAASAFFRKIRRRIGAGISTKDIERSFDEHLRGYSGMSPAFKGFMGYPASVCASVNEEIIHGIPSEKKILSNGDLVSIDLGIKFKGLFVDTARSFFVGRPDRDTKRLALVTQKALHDGIKTARAGNRLGDIGAAVQKRAEKNGYSVIRKFVGHGIGRELHQSPEVPNFGRRDTGPELKAGMALAIEPMVAAGTHEITMRDDHWTAVTRDGRLAAHFEHTIAITAKGTWIITQ